MKDWVPKDRLGASGLNDVFLKFHPYESTSKFQECEIGAILDSLLASVHHLGYSRSSGLAPGRVYF